MCCKRMDCASIDIEAMFGEKAFLNVVGLRKRWLHGERRDFLALRKALLLMRVLWSLFRLCNSRTSTLRAESLSIFLDKSGRGK